MLINNSFSNKNILYNIYKIDNDNKERRRKNVN